MYRGGVLGGSCRRVSGGASGEGCVTGGVWEGTVVDGRGANRVVSNAEGGVTTGGVVCGTTPAGGTIRDVIGALGGVMKLVVSG